MSVLTLSLLGPLEIVLSNEPLEHLRVRSAQALLLFLAVEGHTQQREFLVELLWPGMSLTYGRKNLRQTLYELRRAIPSAGTDANGKEIPLIIADRQTIGLNPQATVKLDTAAFERLISSGLPENLEQAVALYRGEFLSDFYLPDSSNFEEWTSSRRAAYQRQVLEALQTLANIALEAAEYNKAEEFARRQLALDDLHEPAVKQLMIALAGQDQRNNALQLYGELHHRLQKALGVEPAEETTTIFKQIQEEKLVPSSGAKMAAGAEEMPIAQGEAAQGRGSSLSYIAEPAGRTHNLPAAATPFIGRTAELAEIEELLLSTSHRLLTLLGPGGIGKSRLALEAAGGFIDHDLFPDSVWFVPLAALEEPEQVVPAIAAVLPFDFYGSQEPERQLLDYLDDKRLLLILDNMEQLLVSGPLSLLQQILARAEGVKLLATSRAPVHVQGEQLYRVNGLALPASLPPSSRLDIEKWARQFDAVRLFENSAMRVCPDFKLEESNIDHVLAIGRMVEGFPLGLEMAAAWIELLSPAEIQKELSSSFDLLEAEWTPSADRHHSARAVFEWSWQLLSTAEQALCQVLSLFRGGFSREAALSVGQASLPTLLSLKRKSWLQQSEDDRYHIHELLRQYAEEKLREDEETLRSASAGYAHYFISYFEHLAQAVRGPQQLEAFDAIMRDFENARVAWQWLTEQGRYIVITGGLLPALFTYASATGRFPELGGLINTTRERLAREQPRQELQTAALALNAAICKLDYDFYGGDVFGEVTVSWELLRDSWEILIQEPTGFTDGPWAVLVATFYGWQRDREQGLRRIRELAQHYQDKHDRWLYAMSIRSLGELLAARATQSNQADALTLKVEAEEAHSCMEQALELFVELGDSLEQSRTLRWLGQMAKSTDPAAALSYYQQADALLKAINVPIIRGFAHLAMCYITLGQYEEAFSVFAQARHYYERQGNRALLTFALTLESMQSLRYGDIEHARELRVACNKIHQELNEALNVYYGSYELGEIDRISGRLDQARRHYQQALASFTNRDHPHGQAFCERGLGDLALLNHDYEEARRHYEAAIALAKEPFIHSWLTCQTQTRLAQTEIYLGNSAAAEEHLQLAARFIKFREIIDTNDLLLLALAEKTALFLITGAYDQALTLGTFVAHNPVSWHETRWRVEEIIVEAAEKLTSAACRTAERQGRQMTLDGALALAGWD